MPGLTNGSQRKRRTEAAEEQEPARVLIVEDDFLIAMQTETALIEAGFYVVGTATTAEEAIILASQGTASVPGGDGHTPRERARWH